MMETVRGNTALHIAARSGSAEAVRALLYGINAEMWQRARLLWIAYLKPNDGQLLHLSKDMTRLLASYLMRDCLSTNKLVRVKNHDGYTALELAMKDRCNGDVVKLLLNHSAAEIIQESPLGSALHAAAAYGLGERCRMLVRTAGDVNALNRRGETPLYRACCAYPETSETVKTLLALNADPTIAAHDGHTPLDEAVARHYKDSADLIKKFLLKRNAH